MKKIFYHAVIAQFFAFTCLFISCTDKTTGLYYYSGDQEIEITVSGDTLGFLLKDTLISDPSDSAKPVKSSSQFFDSHFSKPGYSSAGNLIHDSISYNRIKLLKGPGNDNNLRAKENSAQDIKKAYPNIIGHAGYLIRVKSTNQPLILTDEIILEFNKGVTQTTIDNILQDYGLQIRRRNPFYQLQITVAVTAQSPSHTLEISQQLKHNSSIKYAQLNLIHIKKFHSVIPGDEFFSRQWHYQNLIADPTLAAEDADIDADLAWDFTKGSENTILAVFDADMDIQHDDLKNSLAHNPLEIPGNTIDDDGNTLVDDAIGWNFILNSGYVGVTGCEETPQDCFGYHGTAVMGVAAAESNEIGVTGICPECKLLPVRTDAFGVYDVDGYAFDYARTRGARIFTLSWEYNGTAAPMNIGAAFERATENGIVIFVSMSDSEIPDCVEGGLTTLPNTIAVSGSTSKDESSHYGWGNCLDILAPTNSHIDHNMPKFVTTDYTGDTGLSYTDEASGANIDGDCGNFISLNYTTCFGGTSASTPLVAGVAGLILSVNPSLTPKQVQYLLQDCADKIENSKAEYSPKNGKSQTETHGYGRLNAFEAVKIASPDFTKGGRNGVDIFLRDNELDWGNTEKPSSYSFEPVRGTQGWWKSQDIKVDAPDASSNFTPPANSLDFENLTDESPVGGKTNKVYVRVRNRGFKTASSVSVKLYWVHAGASLPPLASDFWDLFPANASASSEWNSLGTQSIFSLEYSGESVAVPVVNPEDDKAQIVSFDFPAPVHDPSTRNHYCLMAIISSPDDMMPTEELKSNPERLNMDYVTTHYNNATHRNYNIVTADAAFSAEFFMYNPSTEATSSKLEVSFKGQKIPVLLSDSLQGKLVYLNKNEKKLVTLNIDPRGLKEPTEVIIQQLIAGKKKDEFKVIGGINYFIMPSSNKSTSSKKKK